MTSPAHPAVSPGDTVAGVDEIFTDTVETVSALSKVESDTLSRLQNKLRRDAHDLQIMNSYYEGTQRLEQLGIAIPDELRRFVVMVNWPRIAVDSLEERIDFEGFRLPGKHERDEELWRIWQANNLDEESQLAHLDALVYGRSYICVGTNEDDPNTPLVTVESPLEMTAEISPRTRKVTAALRLWKDKDDEGYVVDKAVLYLPDSTVWLEKRYTGTQRGWVAVVRDEHELGRVPVVPIINRSRVSDRDGRSELADVITLTDAAARALTLAQLATETLSVPQKAVLGATAEDFVGPDGKILPKWEAYFGSVWALENENAKFHQFTAADLNNFKTIIDHYASLVASVTGLPMRFFGQNTANPPSEGAIVADETRLIKHAERRHRAWGGDWEEVARIVKIFKDGSAPDDWDSLESIWRNPATPTKAQEADAAVKLVTAGILPIEAAWEEMGYSQTRITQLREMRKAQIADADVLTQQVNAIRGAQGAPGAENIDPATGAPSSPPSPSEEA